MDNLCQPHQSRQPCQRLGTRPAGKVAGQTPRADPQASAFTPLSLQVQAAFPTHRSRGLFLKVSPVNRTRTHQLKQMHTQSSWLRARGPAPSPRNRSSGAGPGDSTQQPCAFPGSRTRLKVARPFPAVPAKLPDVLLVWKPSDRLTRRAHRLRDWRLPTGPSYNALAKAPLPTKPRPPGTRIPRSCLSGGVWLWLFHHRVHVLEFKRI